MKKTAIFCIFIVGLSLIVDINVAGPIGTENGGFLATMEITEDDLNFSMDTLQYIIDAIQYFVRNADRIDLNSYEEYMGLLNMFEDDAFGHAEQRSRPRFFGILEDTFKSFFGLKDKPKKHRTTSAPNVDQTVA